MRRCEERNYDGASAGISCRTVSAVRGQGEEMPKTRFFLQGEKGLKREKGKKKKTGVS